MAMLFDPKLLHDLADHLTATATELDHAVARIGALLATSGRWSPAVATLTSVADGHRSRSSDLVRRADWLRTLPAFTDVAGSRPRRGDIALEEVERLTEAINRAERNRATEAELGEIELPLFRAREAVRSLAGEDVAALLDGGADLSVLFATITPDQRAAVVQRRAAVLGPHPEAPLDVRVEANRHLITSTIERLEHQADQQAKEAVRLRSGWWPPLIFPSPWSHGGPLDPPLAGPYVRSPAEIAADREKQLRSEIAVLEELLAGQVVHFDWDGAGRVAEWVGPLNATNVAISIPGTGNSKLSLPTLRARAERIVANADPDVAVVAAMMYDAPDNLAEAALDRYATEGAGEIATFVGGLVAPGRHLAVIGHSYGSTVMGETLVNGLGDELSPRDDVVILGSPGVHVDHAADLGVRGTVWAAQVEGDEIALTGLVHNANCLILDSLPVRPPGLVCANDEIYHHGVNPVHPAFGATVFETGAIPDGDVGFLAEFGDEHSEYWAMVDGAPSEALANLIRIIQGDYEEITLVEP